MEKAERVPVMTTLPPAPESLPSVGNLRKDIRPIDANVEELGFCARTCEALLVTMCARTSMTTTSISMMRTKVMKTSVVTSEGLRNDSKNVYVSLSGNLKKTINFHETLPQESEFLSKCRHY